MALPYVFDRYDPRHGDGVNVSLDLETSVVVLELHGSWTTSLQQVASTAVHKCLTEHPATLLVDLRDLTDPRARSATAWLAAWHAATAMDPAVQLILCLPPDTALARRLDRLGTAWLLPVFATMGLARAAAAERLPLTGRHDLCLAPDENAAAMARGVLTDTCAAWRMAPLRDRGRLVVSELVANAVEHAGTPISVVLSRRAGGLHLAVRDGDPRMPRLLDVPVDRPGTGAAGRGFGLHTVQAAATSWGAMPTEGGKVVWALIQSWRRPPHVR